MPTPDEIRQYRKWRGRLVNAVWDAEHAGGNPATRVSVLLPKIGAQDLPTHAIARLVNDLVRDGLLEEFSLPNADELYAPEVKLTSAGRLEVESWIADDAPTDHLALTPSQTFSTPFPGPVAGASVIAGGFPPIGRHLIIHR